MSNIEKDNLKNNQEINDSLSEVQDKENYTDGYTGKEAEVINKTDNKQTDEKKNILATTKEDTTKKPSKWFTKENFISVGTTALLFSCIIGGLVVTNNTNSDDLKAQQFSMDENKKTISEQIKEIEKKETELKEKESEIADKEEKYQEELAKFKEAKKEFELDQSKEVQKQKQLAKEAEKYENLIGELLNTNDSSLYDSVNAVSKNLTLLGDDVDLMKDKKWKKNMLKSTDTLNKNIKTIRDFNVADVPSIHKSSYNELISAITAYEKATKNIEMGIKNNKIDNVVEGSTDMSEGAKHFQIAMNIYSTEISNDD